MHKIFGIAVVACSLACFMAAPAAQAIEGDGGVRVLNAHRIGLGVNYWKTIDNIDQKFDENGFSYLASYQYVPVWFFKVEADLEYYPDLANSRHPVVAPEAFVTFGGLIYAGAGIGVYYHDSDWGSSPFYMLRAGLDIPVLPRLFLDVNVNYRFNDWKTLEWSDLDTDTIRVGAALRFTL